MPDSVFRFNTDEFIGHLNRVPGQIRQASVAWADDVSTLWLRDVRTYPTRPTTRYTRTGTLRRSWLRETRIEGNSVVAEVKSSGNVAPYNRWVQDEDRQARMHRPFWKNTLQGSGRRREPEFRRMAEDRLRQYVRG
jgi:hypothetical protein